ncbi:hypothetical protein WI93_17950 [Burkholderia vietnamiensis]|uniref:hypothetical protein n=1 Tax=Burkholderia vietnamiensis TaxID=60552 RepID=UPI00075BF989|nr:hypothetical protein [Burkholderia vietnamiensis]KVE24837.1 hypothetical protein WI93_17950 [Burkholderia vietnamiensis]
MQLAVNPVIPGIAAIAAEPVEARRRIRAHVRPAVEKTLASAAFGGCMAHDRGHDFYDDMLAIAASERVRAAERRRAA